MAVLAGNSFCVAPSVSSLVKLVLRASLTNVLLLLLIVVVVVVVVLVIAVVVVLVVVMLVVLVVVAAAVTFSVTHLFHPHSSLHHLSIPTAPSQCPPICSQL